MLESEAKKKKCPHFQLDQTLSIINLSILDGNQSSVDEYKKAVAVFHKENLCKASGCMMWECELKEEIHVDEKPSLVGEYAPELVPPEGDGWKEKGRRVHSTARSADPFAGANQSATITWHRWVPADRGDCGLKTKELYCNASC